MSAAVGIACPVCVGKLDKLIHAVSEKLDTEILRRHNQLLAAFVMDLNTKALLSSPRSLKLNSLFSLGVFNLYLRFAKYHHIGYVDEDDAVLCALSSKQYTRICSNFKN